MLRWLVPDPETAARTVPEARRAEVFELMAATYQACSAALAKLGEPEAAWIAADLAMAAADRAGNPLLVAAGAFRQVFVFISARHHDQAEETARTAAAALAPLADRGDRQAMSLWGGLTLQRAVTAARLGDPDTAYGRLERARQMAGRLGEGRNDYNTEFGPANACAPGPNTSAAESSTSTPSSGSTAPPGLPARTLAWGRQLDARPVSATRTPRSHCACTPTSSATSSPRPPISSPARSRPPSEATARGLRWLSADKRL